jgi:hypothetical protein
MTVEKAQWIRIADVVFVGPLMIYAATRLPDRHRTAAWTLGALGIGTIVLNGANYLAQRSKVAAPPLVAAR